MEGEFIVFWILCIIVIVVVLLALSKRPQPSASEEVWPYYAKKVLSAPEQVLYFRLVQALPDHLVLAQVQLSRFLGVKKGQPYQTWLNRIHQMSADFVICQKDTSVFAVIELDDASHLKPARIAADAKKDRALRAAEIPIFRWPVNAIPEVQTLRNTLINATE